VDAFVLARQNLWPVVVTIPARNEADWIPRCLAALNGQLDCACFHVVLLVNNSGDATADIARGMQPGLSYALHVLEHEFSPQQQSAGQARYRAMSFAAGLLPFGGTLLCTDADGQVAPDWLAANLFHIRQGADAVAGRAVIDALDAKAIPAALHEDDARECAYTDLLDEIDCLLDSDPADPWPRHTEHSGASICVTLDAYRRAGGIAPLPVGEDRAFFAALRRVDARIRHAPDVQVTVSGRIQGRAVGGMADTIRRRLVAPDRFLDDALEPAADRARRARLRAEVRRVFHGHGRVTGRLLREIGVEAAALGRALRQPRFGMAWAAIEGAAASLAPVRVPVSALAVETKRAQRLLVGLHQRGLARSPGQIEAREPGFTLPLGHPPSEMSRMAG